MNDELVTKKNSCVSLSDFLDRKLHKSSVLPKTVQVLFYFTPFWLLRKYWKLTPKGEKKVSWFYIFHVFELLILSVFKDTKQSFIFKTFFLFAI